MSKKKSTPFLSNLSPLKVGTPCIILRPHLWSGGVGEVVSYDPETTLHRVKIAGKNGATFHTDCMADVLKVDYARMLEV